MRVVVAQKGAREHFAVAQALHAHGWLARLVVDWYAFGQSGKRKADSGEAKQRAADGRSIFQRLVGSGQAARAEGIPDESVRAFRLRSLWWKWIERRAARNGRLYAGYLETDAAFARAVARLNLPPHDVFFGYSYASLEMLESERRRGVFTLLDQIDPGPAEFHLVAEEMARYPELAGAPPKFPTAYYDRLRQEWKLADVILVNSEWSREAITAEGADPAKIEVIPLAYEVVDAANGDQQSESRVESQPATAPLRVLWLGQVNVRKGIHYLMEAARQLVDEPVKFDVVGPIGILPAAVSSAPSNMTFHGPISRDRVAQWYQESDVFVLPTLSDGFALTQLEALAFGRPVIATPNCGRVVADGQTGFIVPPRDVKSLAEAILKFVRNRSLASEMAAQCRESVKAYSIDTYGQRLMTIIQQRMAKRRR